MGEPEKPRARAFALMWMTHPITVAALVVMVVNDHLLKSNFGTWWTGKLSDLAGIAFFPALVAVAVALAAPRIREQVVTVASLSVTTAAFVLVKGTAWGAGEASRLLSSLFAPSVVRQDATDLLALGALALAAWSAHRSSAEPTQLRTRGRRALAVAIIPAAVLATAATSTQGHQIASGFVAAGEDLYLAAHNDEWCAETEVESECTQWYQLSEDETWVEVDSRPHDGRAAEDCTPGDPFTCYRPGPGISVQVTRDGGRIWTTEWSLSDEDAKAIADNAGDDISLASTMQIAVMPRGDSYRVWAASGLDGLALRHVDGTWERLGWTTVGDPSYAPTAPPSVEPEAAGELAHAPLMFAWSGILIPACAWLVLERGRRRRTSALRTVLASCAGFVFFVGATLVQSLDGFERLTGFFLGGLFPYIYGVFVYALTGLVATVATVAIAGLAGSLVSRTWTATGIYVSATAGEILVLALVVPNQPAAQFAASALATVGGSAYWYWKGPRMYKEPPVQEPQFAINEITESHIGELS